MTCQCMFDQGELEQIEEALTVAVVMLDKENQPPQFTSEEAFKFLSEAQETLGKLRGKNALGGDNPTSLNFEQLNIEGRL